MELRLFHLLAKHEPYAPCHCVTFLWFVTIKTPTLFDKLLSFFFLVMVGFELRASRLLSRHSTT
jgi:hypothetical protein